MNGNQLDDLFKQKLGYQKLTPPANGWDQIDTNLKDHKRKSPVLWLKIAASAILIFTIGWLLIPSQSNIVAPGVAAKVVEDTSPEVNEIKNDQNIVQPSSQNGLATISDQPQKVRIPANKLTQGKTNILLVALNNNDQKTSSQSFLTFERESLEIIPLLDLSFSSSVSVMSRNYSSQVLPLDLGLMFSYSEEKNEEFKKSRKHRMFNNIISIAKGVNKSKLGFEDIRNAKNGFVNDELKYGVRETDEDVDENDSKSDDLNK